MELLFLHFSFRVFLYKPEITIVPAPSKFVLDMNDCMKLLGACVRQGS